MKIMMDLWYRRKSARIILALFVGALLIRLLVLLMLPSAHIGSNARIAFLGGAHKILHEEGFKDPSYPMFIPPLTALFVAGHFVFFSESLTSVKVTQCVLDAATVVVIYLAASTVFGSGVAFLTAIALGLYPFAIFTVTYIGSEVLFTFLLSLSVLFSLRAIRDGRWLFFCLSGLFLGLATLTRGTTLYYPFFFLLVLWVIDKQLKRKRLLHFSLLLLTFVAVISPWTIRNYLVLDALVPVSTFGGPLLQGSSEEFLTIDQKKREFPKYFKELESRGISPPTEPGWTKEGDSFYRRATLEKYKDRLKEDPIGLLLFMLKKFGRLWYATESGRNHALILLSNILMYVLSVLGIVVALLRRNRMCFVLLGLLLYFSLLHCISLPLFRYMVPMMPYVISFGAFAIVFLWERMTKRHIPSASVPNGP